MGGKVRFGNSGSWQHQNFARHLLTVRNNLSAERCAAPKLRDLEGGSVQPLERDLARFLPLVQDQFHKRFRIRRKKEPLQSHRAFLRPRGTARAAKIRPSTPGLNLT